MYFIFLYSIMVYNFLNFNKFLGEILFFLDDLYFIINIFILIIISLFLSKYINSLLFNVFLIDLSIIICLFLFVLTCYSYDINVDLFLGFRLNCFFILFKLIIIFFLLFFLFISKYVFVFDKVYNFEYIFFILFSIQSFFFIVFTNNFFIFFLSIELQLLCSYVLASLKRYSNFSTEAGMKYFLFGAFSSSLLLFGLSLIYGLLGSLDIYILYFVISNYYVDFFLMFISIFFIFVGILFKLGAVPFHWWLPDVYEGSPSIVTLFFSIFPKLSIFFFLIKVNFFFLLFKLDIFLIVVGIFSILIGFINALFQFKIKRFLAYSSIFTIGYLLIIFSQVNLDSFCVVIFYLFCYSITLMSLFFFILHFRLRFYHELFFLYELCFSSKFNSLIGICLVIIFFSFAGIPPLIGFSGKFYLFLFLINNYNYFLVFFVLFCSFLSSFYYIRVVRFLFFTQVNEYRHFFIYEISFFIFLLLFLNLYFFLFFDMFIEFLFFSLFNSFLF